MPSGSRQRTASIRTLQFSEFRLLGVTTFLGILTKYPETQEQINRLAETRANVMSHESPASDAQGPVDNRLESPTKPPGTIMNSCSHTLIESLLEVDIDVSTMQEALLSAEDKNERVQLHVKAIMQSQLETQARLEELQSTMKDLRSTQGAIRRSCTSTGRRLSAVMALPELNRKGD